MHTKHTSIPRVVSVEGSLSHQGITDRSLNLLRKLQKLLTGPGDHCAAAHEYIGLLSLLDHMYCSIQRLFGNGIGTAWLLFQRHRHILRPIGGDILGNIHQYRTGSAPPGDGEGTSDGIGQLRHILHNKVMLRDGGCDTCDINFLKAVLSQKVDTHVAGDSHHRNGVHVGSGNTGHQVRCPRPGRGKAHAHFSGGTRITIRRMSCSLLVGGQHMLYFIAMFI